MPKLNLGNHLRFFDVCLYAVLKILANLVGKLGAKKDNLCGVMHPSEHNENGTSHAELAHDEIVL
jgi:hypothetical protein